MKFVFEDATPEAGKARLVIDGLSGSGKTLTSLRIARGLVGPDGTIGVVDTEHGKASTYSRLVPFKTIKLHHYAPEDLTAATADAASQGIDCLVVDTGTAFWSGRGGMLEKVSSSKKSGPFGGWDAVRPIEQEMFDALLSYPGHVIMTLRVKAEWAIGEDEKGRPAPIKIGTKPDQRDQIEYEFDIAASMDLTHTMTITKSRLFDVPDAAVGMQIPLPGEEFGELVGAWFAKGVPQQTILDYRARVLADDATIDHLMTVKTEAEQRNMHNLPVVDAYGSTVSLVDLIRAQWKEAAARQRGQSSPSVVADVQQAITQAPAVAALQIVGENMIAAIEAGKLRDPEKTSLSGLYEQRMAELQQAEMQPSVGADR
ncbi:AAA family ATPase [Nonomuraea fuscirosea]|uniref:AAA family ATPase n=1 Tax=Nonomuraea fuscirosea TaxID=1291556 RepID=UPI00371E14A1